MFYKSNKKKTFMVIFIMTLVMVGGYVLGLYIGNRESDSQLSKNGEEPGYQTMQAARDGKKDIFDEKVVSDSVTTKSTLMMFEKYYSSCGEKRVDERKILAHEIGLSKEELETKFPNWDVHEFSVQRILFRMEIEGYCPKHFILKDRAGLVIIYTPSDEGDHDILFEETQIPTSMLPAEIQDEISRGLIMDSLEELEHFMENFES